MILIVNEKDISEFIPCVYRTWEFYVKESDGKLVEISRSVVTAAIKDHLP